MQEIHFVEHRRTMRVGQHYGIHLYLVDPDRGTNPEYPDDSDEPVGTMLRADYARQVAGAWNLANSMLALGEQGFHCLSDTDLALERQKAREEGYLSGRTECESAVNTADNSRIRLQRDLAEANRALASERVRSENKAKAIEVLRSDMDKIGKAHAAALARVRKEGTDAGREQQAKETSTYVRGLEDKIVQLRSDLAQRDDHVQQLQATRMDLETQLGELRRELERKLANPPTDWCSTYPVKPYTVAQVRARCAQATNDPTSATVLARKAMLTAVELADKLDEAGRQNNALNTANVELLNNNNQLVGEISGLQAEVRRLTNAGLDAEKLRRQAEERLATFKHKRRRVRDAKPVKPWSDAELDEVFRLQQENPRNWSKGTRRATLTAIELKDGCNDLQARNNQQAATIARDSAELARLRAENTRVCEQMAKLRNSTVNAGAPRLGNRQLSVAWAEGVAWARSRMRPGDVRDANPYINMPEEG